MKRSLFLRAAATTILVASFALGGMKPANAKLGEEITFVAYSQIANRAWVTLYKQGTFGNRSIIGSGWMPAHGFWKHPANYGNTYFVRAEVMDANDDRIYDTTVTWDEHSASSVTLMKGNGNYYWK